MKNSFGYIVYATTHIYVSIETMVNTSPINFNKLVVLYSVFTVGTVYV